MISSIFGKTKPINFIIILTFLFLIYWPVQIFLNNTKHELIFQILFFAVLALSFFVVDFIVKKNKITKSNSFTILFYALLILAFPETLTDENAIFCTFFIMLAMRRLISIKSLENIKYKIFDATIWVFVSSIFYEWSILYLILVFLAIYIYEPKNTRNWMVPFVGIFSLGIIGYCISALANNTDFVTNHYQFLFDFDHTYVSQWSNSKRLLVYILLAVFALLFSFLKVSKVRLGQIVTMRLIGLSFFLGLCIKSLSFASDAHPVMLTFFPAAVFFTNLVESIKRPNIKEVVLIVAVTVPILILITTLVIIK